MRRKFLSVLLAMAMVLTLVPVTALAETTLAAGDFEVAANVVYDGADHKATAVTIKDKANKTAQVTYTFKASGTEVTEVKNTGTYAVTATVIADDNFAEAEIELGNFVIAQKELSFTAKNQTIDVGGTVPDISTPVKGTHYDITGLVAADEASADTIVTAVAMKYTDSSDVDVTANDVDTTQAGTYNIVITGATIAANGNYKLAASNPYTNGTLTINGNTGGETVAVTGVTLNKTSTSIAVGSTETLTATVAPTNATNKAVTWESSDIGKATVANGVVTAVAEGTATITVKTADGNKTATCAVTVTAASSSGSGSSSSGGSSSDGGSSSSTVTVPVSGDDKSVDVSASVSGSTATIDKIDGLDKVIDSDVDTGVVEIDLTALKKDIDTVKVSTSALKDIAKAAADSDNDVEGMAVKLDSGTVTFDVDALDAIVDQATGGTIELVLEKAKSSDLNSSQKDAVKDMDIYGRFELKLTGGKVITDFKGGKASVRIPFSVPSGKDAANFVVMYVANDGKVEEMNTKYSNGYLSFTTGHFSKYVIAYKDSEPVEPEEPVDNTPVTADCDGGAGCPAGRFTDVNTDMWYHKALDYVITNGLMSGVGDNTFSPNANLSRAMLAQILYNQAGRPAVTGDSAFDDVAAGMWYSNAVAWATENGVVSGYGDGKFGPNDNITREQLAVMLYRYAGSPVAGGSLDSFADAGNVSGYAQNALVWATSNGVMSGKGGGMLDPQGLATRAEVAQMLYNYLSK